MKDIEMTLNWIKAYAVGWAVTLAGFSVVLWFYVDAMRRYGLLPEGGAL